MSATVTPCPGITAGLSNEQVLEFMRQDPRTTVHEFRAKLEAAIGMSVDSAIRQRIAAMTDSRTIDLAYDLYQSYRDDDANTPADVRVALAEHLTQGGSHG